MSTPTRPTSRTEATAPEATEHLTKGEKRALDLQGDAEHADGLQREHMEEEAERLSPPDEQTEQ